MEKGGFPLYKIIVFGLVIGIAAIVPGLSGGTLAVSLGIYPLLIGSLVDLKKEFRRSLGFLIPFGLSALVGLLLFGVVMKPLLARFERSIIWLFMGLILGSLPAFLKEANRPKFRWTFLVPLGIAFVLGLVLTVVTGYEFGIPATSPVMMLIGGGILAIGTVVPGISSSFIMMQLGIYDEVIDAFVSFRFGSMLFVVLGTVTLFLLTLKLVNRAFEKFHGFAHYAALGFLVSSMLGVFPGLSHFTDILLLLAGFAGIYSFNAFVKPK